MSITILTVCRDCRVCQRGSIGPLDMFVNFLSVFICLYTLLKNFLFSVKYLAVYKYLSHIKSFSNSESGPQLCVVGESVRLSGPWYWRCTIFLLYIIICELAAVNMQVFASARDFCTNTPEWAKSLCLLVLAYSHTFCLASRDLRLALGPPLYLYWSLNHSWCVAEAQSVRQKEQLWVWHKCILVFSSFFAAF